MATTVGSSDGSSKCFLMIKEVCLICTHLYDNLYLNFLYIFLFSFQQYMNYIFIIVFRGQIYDKLIFIMCSIILIRYETVIII